MTDGLRREKASCIANTIAVSCEGKTRFLSFTAANIVVGRRKHKRKAAEPLEPYHCRFCQGWHLAGVKQKRAFRDEDRPKARA